MSKMFGLLLYKITSFKVFADVVIEPNWSIPDDSTNDITKAVVFFLLLVLIAVVVILLEKFRKKR